MRVALDTPVRREFSYRVPSGIMEVGPGQRVQVPFGSRNLVGVVVGVDPHPPANVPAGKLRAITARLDEEALITPGLLRLANYLAAATFCSVGQAAAAMLLKLGVSALPVVDNGDLRGILSEKDFVRHFAGQGRE